MEVGTMEDSRDENGTGAPTQIIQPANRAVGLLGLPTELVDAILSYLSPGDLCAVAQASRALCRHAYADAQWQRHVLANLPGRNDAHAPHAVKSPYPFATWRELYACHDPYWFIPRHKLWFSDGGGGHGGGGGSLAGQLVVAQYDARRGAIEAFRLVAERLTDASLSQAWPGVSHRVHVHLFEPRVRLHRDRPVLSFRPEEQPLACRTAQAARQRLLGAFQMPLDTAGDARRSSIMLAKPLPAAAAPAHLSGHPFYPYGGVWPVPMIPSAQRVLGAAAPEQERPRHHTMSPNAPARGVDGGPPRPRSRAETSDRAFHVRQWMLMNAPVLGVHPGVHAAEELVTWATLDPRLYTPTPEKPWRGIWVGDYSEHGCEFLLVHQPGDDLDDNLLNDDNNININNKKDGKRGKPEPPLVRHEGESDEAFADRFRAERVFRGRLEAIKLTGDPNVPRGECTFRADDIGEAGFVGYVDGPPFERARVVRSKGHIAALGFMFDKFMDSQLIFLGPDRLAQHWDQFGHVSFFERVNIDQFLVPT